MSTNDTATRFEQEAGKRRSSIVAEFWQLLRENKKWWLAPILIVFLLFGVLMFLGTTAAAPFIYTLF